MKAGRRRLCDGSEKQRGMVPAASRLLEEPTRLHRRPSGQAGRAGTAGRGGNHGRVSTSERANQNDALPIDGRTLLKRVAGAIAGNV